MEHWSTVYAYEYGEVVRAIAYLAVRIKASIPGKPPTCLFSVEIKLVWVMFGCSFLEWLLDCPTLGIKGFRRRRYGLRDRRTAVARFHIDNVLP